ncbi:MAG: 23S rRNA (adenine(2503)-C(2))-methyltransferase RlmN [bacterium]
MNIFELTCAELAGELNRHFGKGEYHAAGICREVFKKGRTSFGAAPEFKNSQALAKKIATAVRLPECTIGIIQEDDSITKFASQLADGNIIESVIIPSNGRNTLCVSSQAGCRMGCMFCKTGEMGFTRNLTAGEIVWQVHTAIFSFSQPIDNVVFMGMGEPLDNFNNVMQAVNVISDQRGLDIPRSHITISTAGHVDGIRQLAATNPGNLCLAVSVNSADDRLRSRLMPINRKYPLASLKKELLAYPLGKRGIIFIEYVLLACVNDSKADADQLAAWLTGLRIRINVISCNPGSSTAFKAPSPEHAAAFCKWLADRKLFVRRRQSRGLHIQAACGQLTTV